MFCNRQCILAVAKATKAVQKKPHQTCSQLKDPLFTLSPQQGDLCFRIGGIRPFHSDASLQIHTQDELLSYQKGMPFSRNNIYHLLHRYTNENDISSLRQLHCLMVCSELDNVSVLGDQLIRFFSERAISEASIVFCRIADPSIQTWHAILHAYVKHQEYVRTLQLYDTMQNEGVQPNKYAISCLLKVCSCLYLGTLGASFHDHLVRLGDDYDAHAGSALIDMYTCCGYSREALKVLEKLQCEDIVVWNTMMVAYIRQEDGLSTLRLFEKMQKKNIKPGKVTLSSVLKACAIVEAIYEGRLIHDFVLRLAFESNPFIGSGIVNMYARCGWITDAIASLNSSTCRNVTALWNALLSSCVQLSYGALALEIYTKMQSMNIVPDIITFYCVLGACSCTMQTVKARLVHDELIRTGFESNFVISSTLIDLYANCGLLDEALKVFNRLPAPNLWSWSAIIGGHVLHGHSKHAFDLFLKMQGMGYDPDKPILLSAIQACIGIRALEEGRLVHFQAVHDGVESDIEIGGSLISMYAVCGDFKTAHVVLDNFPKRDMVSWCALLTAYVDQGCYLDALKAYEKLIQDGIIPDEIMYSYILKAYSEVGAINHCDLVVMEITENGFDRYSILSPCMVEMYIQCGRLADAYKILSVKETQSQISWNIMISGCAQHGDTELAIKCFGEMQKQGFKPDEMTFTNMLSACCHAGELNKGVEVFTQMQNKYDLAPNNQHANCMVDLLAKSGHLKEAEAVIVRMPTMTDNVGRRSVLLSNWKFGNSVL